MSYFQCMFFLIVVISINCSVIDIEPTTLSWADRVVAEIQQMRNEIEKEENELKEDREVLTREKRILNLVNCTDVFRLNVGGEIFTTTRQTLTQISKSIFSVLFNGRWEQKLQMDTIGNIFFDFNPVLFRHLLDQLQTFDSDDSVQLLPPSQSSLTEPFKKMLRKLGFDQLLSSEKKDVIIFNVGGQTMTSRRTTFAAASNLTSDTIVAPPTMAKLNDESDVFVDYDPKLFQHLVNQLREESSENISYLGLTTYDERVTFETMLSDLNIYRQQISFSSIFKNTKWKLNALTIAGGNGSGNQSNQLHSPHDIYIDEYDQCIYIADCYNDRIIRWRSSAKMGQVVAGGNGEGDRMDQLKCPTNVIVDKTNDFLIICDSGNRRVVRWLLQNVTRGETIIVDIACYGLIMDNDRNIYISDRKKNEVRRWKIGETKGIVVAGGNGQGNQLNQLNYPSRIFVDEDQSVYVSDTNNHRVMKWVKGAKEGIVVAGGYGEGNNLRQLSYPRAVIVDLLGNVYVADSYNNRIVCWSKRSKEGRVIVGGNGQGQQSNQLNGPWGLSFDRQGNHYIVEFGNHRIQKFAINQQ